MSPETSFLLQAIAWPLVLLLAWLLADALYVRWQIPRVTSYVAVGVLAGGVHLPGVTNDITGLPFVATVALSLFLLPRLKGVMIAIQWAKRMHGFGRDLPAP